MGTAGRPEAFFPGFGWNSGENRSRKLRFGPCYFWESSPLRITTNSSRWMSTVVKMLFGGVVFMARLDDRGCPNLLLLSDFGACCSKRDPWSRHRPDRLLATERGETRLSGTRMRRSIIRLRIRYRHLNYYAPQYIPTTYQAQICPSRPAIPQVSSAPLSMPHRRRRRRQRLWAAGDPYGFVGWLNATRAAYGLSAVGYDANLSNWAAMNNNQQAARGMGHFVMGPARRQNSAMGAFANIGSMWMNSPAHRAALLDPTITRDRDRWPGCVLDVQRVLKK